MQKVLFAGSFDPFTIGHYSVFDHACKLFGEKNVFVGVAQNTHKSQCYLEHLKWTINPVSENVLSIPPNTLVADFCLKHEISHLVRSMRNTTDFNYEMDLVNWNRKFGVETLFIPCQEGYEKISSSSVRTLACYGKNISEFMPPLVYKRWISKPKRLIITGFIGSGKSSYIGSIFRQNYNYFDMDEVAKECLPEEIRKEIFKGIINDNLNSKNLAKASGILLSKVLEIPSCSVIEASALGTYTSDPLSPLRSLYEDSVIIHVNKFSSKKARKIDKDFKQAVLKVQTKPLVIDFVIDSNVQSINEIKAISNIALSLLQ